MKVWGALALCGVLIAGTVGCEVNRVSGGSAKSADVRAIGYDPASVHDGCGDLYDVREFHGVGNAVGRTEFTYRGRACDPIFKALQQ